MKNRFVYTFVVIISVLFTGFILLHAPIPQDINYHNFSDKRTLLGIPHFFNTLSNIPFILVGILGLIDIKNITSEKYLIDFKLGYSFLFMGTVLVGLGSSYYHLNPANDTLVWDRLPMTISFMSLFSIIIAEFISEKLGIRIFWPAVILGVLSVIYWAATESHQHGDLRLYVIIQFLPMIIIPLILISFKGTFTLIHGYWYLLLCYLLAKFAEYFDYQLYDALCIISGHSIKHLLAALGLFTLIISYKLRRQNRIV